MTRTTHKCNCRSKPNCPLNGEFLTPFLVHKTISSTSNSSFVYHGPSEVELTHGVTTMQNFSDTINDTGLSKHVWNLKGPGFDNNLYWQILKKVSPYQYGSKRFSGKVSFMWVEPNKKCTSFQVLPLINFF